MSNSFHGIVDIHHHLVYGLDDGSQSMEQTIQMLELAYRNGVDCIVADAACRTRSQAVLYG